MGFGAAMSRMEEYFERPLEFLPERWQRDRPHGQIHPFASLPFSHGTRMCIGKRLAEQEIYTFLIRMVQRYTVTFESSEEMEVRTPLVLKPVTPLAFRCEHVLKLGVWASAEAKKWSYTSTLSGYQEAQESGSLGTVDVWQGIREPKCPGNQSVLATKVSRQPKCPGNQSVQATKVSRQRCPGDREESRRPRGVQATKRCPGDREVSRRPRGVQATERCPGDRDVSRRPRGVPGNGSNRLSVDIKSPH
ncbi:Cytochrome P450 [Trinorchestia longiramus]|nr:Cytochrome P450 [Trinorchestia longiramus]